jgi:GTPase SAR1 family protein
MMQEQEQRHMIVFFSYAQTDQIWYEQFAKHLSQLKRDGLIEEWSYQQILPGVDRTKEIDQALHSAHVILLLISADFLASDAQYQVEMQHALERHKRGEVRVVPIIVRPCDWQYSPFAHLQCLPRTGKPISTWDHQDEAFLAIVQDLRRLIARQQFPLSSLSQVQRQNRARLLKRVRATWIVDLLEHSLHQAAWIDLHLQDQPDMLANPWRLQVQELNQEPHALLAGTSIIQVYDEAEGELLILGEPGAGKTTLLLHLARTLLDRAEADERLPMPVIFNLSSWARQQQPLTTWLSDELQTKYQVSRRVAKLWIESHQIHPLLDGLDEVAEEARLACMQVITTYCSGHLNQIGMPMVICCRSQEYQELPLHVPLSRAVSILPLTEQQIDAYLSSTQGQLEGLRQALDNDADLATLARRPLMLSIFTLAYQGATAKEFEASSSSQEQILHTVFSHYVKRMLFRRGQLPTGMSEHFLHWLTFVAKQLHQRQQTILLVEDLQPDWLPQKQQHLYQWSIGLVFGLVGALVFGLFFVPIGAPTLVPAGALVFGLAAWLNLRRGGRIRLAEGITWAKEKLKERLFFAPVVVLLIFGLCFAYGIGLGKGLFLMLLFMPAFVLIFGLSRTQLTEKIRPSPNEGIWRSVKNGLGAGLLVGLIIGLVNGVDIGLNSELFFVLFFVLATWLGGWLSLGLDAFIQHFVLRIFLWRTNHLPWNLIPFLDEAAERLLLRKIGGSYIFVHRILLEYFASLEKQEP